MNIYLIFFALLLSTIISSCTKNHSTDSTSSPKDTLSKGWTKMILAGGGNLEDIFFINNTGYVMSDTNIYKSIDAGNSWAKILSRGSYIVNMGMGSDTNAAFAVGPDKIVSTHNGGTSFDTVAVSDVSITDVFLLAHWLLMLPESLFGKLRMEELTG